MESRRAPWLHGESTAAPTAPAPLRLLLNYVGKSILTFTHSGQFLFIYFWLSVSGMPLFLLMKYCFGLFIFRLTVWWRLIDPGIKVQAGKNFSKQTAWLSTPEYFSVSSYNLLYYLKFKWGSGREKELYPSGTGTFFCALGATGFSSPANRAITSSATGTSFTCSFCMYFISCKMQEAWKQMQKLFQTNI